MMQAEMCGCNWFKVFIYLPCTRLTSALYYFCLGDNEVM